MLIYPYYVVTWRTGRLPCPLQYVQIPAIRQQFESGRIGGTQLHTHRCDTVEEVRRVVREHQHESVNTYIVDAPGRPQRAVHWSRFVTSFCTREVGMPELIVPLVNGGSLRCGEGDTYEYGSYLRICDPDGNEILYWDVEEWSSSEDQGEHVIGAVFAAASQPLAQLLQGRELVDGVWIVTPNSSTEVPDAQA